MNCHAHISRATDYVSIRFILEYCITFGNFYRISQILTAHSDVVTEFLSATAQTEVLCPSCSRQVNLHVVNIQTE